MKGDVRIPSSAPRRQPLVYAKLLRRVRTVASSGFDFEGDFLKPGALVDELSIVTDYPGAPVLLECAGISKAGRGHNRSELLYILWQWNRTRREWGELGRACSSNWDWAVDLAPIARRAMGERAVDLSGAAARILDCVGAEMDRVPDNQRASVAAIAHDVLAAQIAAGVAVLSTVPSRTPAVGHGSSQFASGSIIPVAGPCLPAI